MLLAPTKYRSYLDCFLLSFLSAASAADRQTKYQAQILKALNAINFSYYKGDRTVAAISQSSPEKLAMDNSEDWKKIIQELSDEGIEKAALVQEKPFIRTWIDNVIHPDEGYVSDHESQSERASDRASFTTRSSIGDVDPLGITIGNHSPSIGSWSPELSRAQTLPVSAIQTIPEILPRRPRPKQGSVSSQDQNRRHDQLHSPQTNETLMPLFRLEYGISREELLVRKTVEHLYNRLDISKTGLVRRQFESQCLQAVKSVQPAASQGVEDIIHSYARSVGGTFDQTAFSELFFTILEHLQTTRDQVAQIKQQEEQISIEECDYYGESIAYSWLCLEFESRKCHKILPRFYALQAETDQRVFRSVPHDVMCHDTASKSLPVLFEHILELVGGTLRFMMDFWT